jgi:hypothetical protein
MSTVEKMKNILESIAWPVHEAGKPHCHKWANCLESVGSSTSHHFVGLHGQLRGCTNPYSEGRFLYGKVDWKTGAVVQKHLEIAAVE